jgi:hypothetical protein
MDDLDQSGHGYQRVRAYLGPSLGWKEEFVLPTTDVTVGGTYTVKPGDSVLLVEVAAIVTIQLPDVREWVQQHANLPATGFERSLTVKDLGGNAANFNIVIAPFGQQSIDNLHQALVLATARANVKLLPLIDMSGWIVEASSAGSSGSSGGGDVFKAGDNTFTATNTFVGTITVPTVLPADNSGNAASTAWVKNQSYLTNAAGTAAFQPLDADLTSIAGQTAVGAMFYRSATNVWSQVVIGANMSFTGGTLSSTGGGSGGAPIGAQYVVSALDGTLTNERLLTDSATISWDFSTPGVVQANSSAGGGNVSTSGTPTVNQLAQWVTSTTIKGINISALGFQAADGDLTALSGLTGTNTIYYRSATDIWSPVTFSGLSFSGGVLTVTAGGGNVNSSGVPLLGQVAEWTNLNTIRGVNNVPHFYSQNTTPAVGNAGDLWYNTDTGTLSIFITDANSSQWVQMGPTTAPPAAAGFAGINVQTFAAPGTFTYTPISGMKYCQIECVGGGGGGGGVGDTTTAYAVGGGGGSGGYSRRTVPAATVGASQPVTVGGGGNGGGGTVIAPSGGQTSVGALCIANGGSGGQGSSIPNGAAGGGAGGVTAGAVGDIVSGGNSGGPTGSIAVGSGSMNSGAHGGSGPWGGGGKGGAPSTSGVSVAGAAGQGPGAGGGAGGGINTATVRNGGAGAAGFVIITEYF